MKTIARKGVFTASPIYSGGASNLNVLPHFALNDALADTSGNSELFVKSLVSPVFYIVKMPHFNHLLVSKLVGGGFFTTPKRVFSFSVLPFCGPKSLKCFFAFEPSFFKGIQSVVFESPKKQVVRINARGIVAFVADTHSFRNRAVLQFVGVPVSLDLIPVNPNSSVSIFALSKVPLPTTRRSYGYVFPKVVPRCNLIFNVEATTRTNRLTGLGKLRKYKRFSVPAVALANKPSCSVSTGRKVGSCFFNDLEFAEPESDDVSFRRHDVCSFKPIKRCASGGRPASTGARCDYCKPKQWRFNVKQHEIALTN